MALIYRGECKACDAPATLSEDGYLACRLDSGKIECLPHPLEESTLQSLGYSFKRAATEKRLVWVTNVICDTCGHVAKRYKVKTNESCLIYIVIFVVSYGLSLAFVSMPLSLLIAMVSLLMFSLIYSAILRFNVWNAQKMLPELPRCPNCFESKYIPLSRALRKKTVCEKCGQREVVYKVWGIS
jgi:hypothetical protein